MAIYRNIYLDFWTDFKVTEEFTPEDKYFYLYLLTNPHTNLTGCYEVSFKTMAEQTGYNKDTIGYLMNRFKNVHKVIDYSEKTHEVLILHWNRYNWTKSADFLKGLEKQINMVKSVEFKGFLNNLLEEYRPSIDGRGTSVTVTVLNNNHEIKEEYIYRHNNNLKNLIHVINIYKYKDYLEEHDALLEEIKAWMEYKDEKTPVKENHYDGERSIKSLLTEIINKDKEFGTEKVVEYIERSISHNWKGIIWDGIEKSKKEPEQPVYTSYTPYNDTTERRRE